MTHEGYAARMKDSPQFRHFGLSPRWHPGEGDIEGFCHDEVVRQMHDPRVNSDGGCRVKWMLDAWDYAISKADDKPTVADIRTVGAFIEPKYNTGYYLREDTGFRADNIYIGKRAGANPLLIGEFVHALVDQASRVVAGAADMALFHSYEGANFIDTVPAVRTIDDWYLAFEWIHPFRDGNGRSGKVLYNWLMGSLWEPVLVDDYFGGWNP